MKFATIAKILILVFIVVLVALYTKSCVQAVSRQTQLMHQQQPVPVAVQPGPVQQPGQAQVQPGVQQQQQQQQVVSLKPVSDVSVVPDPARAQLVRKTAEFTIYNIQNQSDSMPLFPAIYSSKAWKSGSEVQSYTPKTLTGENAFEPLTLTRIRFYVLIDKAGDYIFQGQATNGSWASNGWVSLRVNDAVIVPLTQPLITGYAKLETGFYLFDIRFVNKIDGGPGDSFTIKVKGPGESVPATISSEDIYWKQEVPSAGATANTKK